MPQSAAVVVSLSRAQARAVIELIGTEAGKQAPARARSLGYAAKTLKVALDGR
jgi:hypothetical protein